MFRFDKKWHWFNFSWKWYGDGKPCVANSISGFGTKALSKDSIRKAAADLKVDYGRVTMPDNAVLISVSYLGRMTEDEYKNSVCVVENR